MNYSTQLQLGKLVALKEGGPHYEGRRRSSGNHLQPVVLFLIASGLTFIAARFYMRQAARKADELEVAEATADQPEKTPVPAVVSALKRGAEHARKQADAEAKAN